MNEVNLEEYKIKGYYPTIGIECHVQLKSKTKLFSSVSNDAIGAKPNTLISHICFGLPGALPVLNKEVVRLSSIAAFALGTKPQKFSKFDRKHYFYPDLPKGYQITQLDQPIILGGRVTVSLEDGTTQTINITRAHIEEDAGKSTHPSGADYSLVDLNRAGTPLLEIVSEPEIHSAKQAKAYAKELWLIMKYAGVSDVNLFHGNMRFDVNVSVSKDPKKLGTRSETKNLNSFKSVERAVDYEIKRQIDLLEKGKNIAQETRGWIDDKQKTVGQRSKEDANDYRYFPDPDIPPVTISDQYINDIKRNMPILLGKWRDKLQKQGLNYLQIEALLESNIEFNANFLSLIADSSKEVAEVYTNWILNIEIPLRHKQIESKEPLEITASTRKAIFAGIHELIQQGQLSSNNARLMIIFLLKSSKIPDDFKELAQKLGYIQMSDIGELESLVDQIIKKNPTAVEEVRSGEKKVIGFLVGQVMKESKGQANPAVVKTIITRKIETHES